ncbi:Lrp/AsnC family transcriptional regulator [Bacillota bacterium LX-D]|nr:Lrp/AsnC family transcriptional regulator [Bacillota bacterium LX-D]
MLDHIDKDIISYLSEDITLDPDLYKCLSQELNITEEELLLRLKKMKQFGYLKRISPIIYHYNTDYTYNGLISWIVSKEKINQLVEMMCLFHNISHIYERRPSTLWPYNFYSMIHGRDKEEIENVIKIIADRTGIDQYLVLYTTREWKKTSPKLSLLI